MVLLPCACCGSTAACACRCECCTCASGHTLNFFQNVPVFSEPLRAVEEFTYFLTDPVPSGEDVPAGFSRRLLPSHYLGLASHIPDCGITRRWQSQAACLAAVPAAENAAIVAAGAPYTYDLFKGRWANESLGKSVSITANFGSGAAAVVTNQVANEITDITVTNGGSGYARLVYPRGAPTITATAPGGAGATLSVTLSQSGDPPQWSVESISVTAGGSGYTTGKNVSFSFGNAVELSLALAYIVVDDADVVWDVEVDASAAGGAGASFDVVWNEPYGDEFFPYSRTIQSITVTNGGSGYDTANGPVVLRLVDGTTAYGYESFTQLTLAVTITDGAIISVDGYVAPDDPEYVYGVGDLLFIGTGPVDSVAVSAGGAYYVEDKSKQPSVETAAVTASVPGSNAQLSVAVDSKSGNATFGQVTAITVTDAKPFPPGNLIATNSSFSISDREYLLEQMEKNAPSHALLSGAVTLADQAAIHTYLQELFAGPLDLAQLHWGYCSESTPWRTSDGTWRLGWSTPHRGGAPLTTAGAAGLCQSSGLPSGAPRSSSFVDGKYVPAAWARPYFFPGQPVPPLQRVVLSGTTGDPIVDALFGVIGYEPGTSAILQANPGYSLGTFLKTVDEPQYQGSEQGKLCVSYSVRKTDAGIVSGYREWILSVCWRPCVNADDNAPLYTPIPHVHIHSYSLTDVTYGGDYTGIIASSADLWAYSSEAACLSGEPWRGIDRPGATLNTDVFCGGDAYKKWFSFAQAAGPGDGTNFYCYHQQPGAAD